MLKILLTLFLLFLSLSYRNQGITWSWLVSGKWEHRDVRVVSSRFLFELCVENYKHYSTRQRYLSHKMFVNYVLNYKTKTGLLILLLSPDFGRVEK